MGALPSDTVKTPKLNSNTITSVLSARSYPTEDTQCSTHIHGSINAITIHPKQQSDSHDDEPAESEEEEKLVLLWREQKEGASCGVIVETNPSLLISIELIGYKS
ncbi:hypothetical protein Tco_0461762 [Tanacetum coccineum]